MFKTRKPIPGQAPATLTARHEDDAQPTELLLTEYSPEGSTHRKLTSVDELPAMADDGKIRWLEMNGMAEVETLRTIGQRYDLHPLALEDVMNTGQRPKVETYDGMLFIVAQMIYRDPDNRMCGEQVSMFLQKDMLITFQEEPKFDVFAPVRERLATGGRGIIRKQGADYLAYALLDSIIDHCYPVLESIGEALDEIEEELLGKPDLKTMRSLHRYKRMLANLRRFVWPERDVVSALLHDDSGLVADSTKIYLRDCYDHSVQIMDLMETYRDVVSGLMEMYLSAVGQRTNETMRVLTVLSAVFSPLTFVVGVYGMNFAPEVGEDKLPLNMPELYLPYGYVGCLLFMATVAAFQLWFFRKKGWL